MGKYIPAEKMIAEIERREMIIRNSASQISDSEKKTYYSGCGDALLELLPLINSLQQEQPEVDLEKEIDAFFDKWDKNSHGCLFDENGKRVTIETIKRVLKHFLNARKEDTK